MTASSDLDLILIYDADEGARESDGRRPLAPAPYYVRFAQRLIAAISAPTAVGGLYEVDMRLRPSGNAGMLATRIDAFESYQARDAWTWEHMALTRARVLCGDAQLSARIQACIDQVMRAPRDPASTAADVRDMRARIHREKGSEDIWNVKAVRGGTTDVEFIAQFLALTVPQRLEQPMTGGTATLLRRLRDAGALAPAAAETLLNATTLYGRILQTLRVATDGRFDPRTAPRGLANLLAKLADEPEFERLVSRLQACEREVVELFEELVGPA